RGPDLRTGPGRAGTDRRAAGIRPGAAGGLDPDVPARLGAEGALRIQAERRAAAGGEDHQVAGRNAGSRSRRVQLMSLAGQTGPLAQRVAEAADLVTVALDELLPRAEGPESRLTEAMRYAALGPGKRLRTYFALETGRMFDVPERSVLRAACALECVHAYSLIHDDLPCMDDDDMRRGRLTVHRAYDEATAVLAGDALQTAAFEILAHPDTHKDGGVRAEMIFKLAQAS